MTGHHFFREEHIRHICIYCKSNLSHNWKSAFHGEHHYKTINCKCGKENHVKVNFHGSGHDSWNSKILKEKKSKTLESKLDST